jgi:heme/copper-type cytochrome/quinol oxidase subunit 2
VSLKSFHIVLISLSSVLALVFGGWSFRAWVETGKASHLGLAVFSFVAAVGLVVYVVWFARRVRSRDEEARERRKLIRPLAVMAAAWLISSRPVWACSVCYGEAEGPMIDAARLGVWLLFGLVLAVQMALVLFFVYLRRRAKQYRASNPHAPWFAEELSDR